MSSWFKGNATHRDRDNAKNKQRNGPQRDRDRCITTGRYSISMTKAQVEMKLLDINCQPSFEPLFDLIPKFDF